jgi:hypothetical protein
MQTMRTLAKKSAAVEVPNKMTSCERLRKGPSSSERYLTTSSAELTVRAKMQA